MKKHPDAKLTLKQAFEKYKRPDLADASRLTLINYRNSIRRWEELSGNPPIGKIDNTLLAQLREQQIEAGVSPSTINTRWRCWKAILRRCGPPETGNPFGAGVLERVPAMRPVRQTHKLPRRLSMEDIAKVYIACRHAGWPRSGVHPGDWWRALIVLALTTGLRKGDLWGLTWSAFDLDAGTVDFTAQKTGKSDRFPLHPCAVAHLRRLDQHAPDAKVFRGLYCSGDNRTGSFYKRWHLIQEIAKVERFGLHDLRRTGASEVERVRPGIAPTFLQHAPRNVSDASYLNRFEELKEAIEAMRLPPGFQSGPKVAARKLEELRQARVAMRQEDFIVPDGPNPADWKFRTGAFWCRGTWYRMESAQRLAVLKELATSPEPVHWSRLAEIIRENYHTSVQDEAARVAVTISNLRARLRRILGLGDDIDPIPCVSRGNGPTGGRAAWTIWLPPEMKQAKGGAA